MLSQWFQARSGKAPNQARATVRSRNLVAEPQYARWPGRARVLGVFVPAVLGVVTLTLGVLGLGEPVGGVRAQPAPPATYAGTVVGLDGAPVVEGTVVEARIGAATCGVAEVFVVEGQARYKVHVAATGPEAGQCGTAGALVTFVVGGEYAGSSYWESGLTILDLVAVRPKPPQSGGGPDATPAGTAPAGTPQPPTSPPGTPRPPTGSPGAGQTRLPSAAGKVCKPGDPPPCGTHKLTRGEFATEKDPARLILEAGFFGADSSFATGGARASLAVQTCPGTVGTTIIEKPGLVASSMSAKIKLKAESDARLTFETPNGPSRPVPNDQWIPLVLPARGNLVWEWLLSPQRRTGTIDYTVFIAVTGEEDTPENRWDCKVEVRSDDAGAPTLGPTLTATATVTPVTTCPPQCPGQQGGGFPKWLLLLAIPVAGLVGGAGWTKRKPIIAFATYRITPPTVFLSYRRDDKDRAELISVSLNAKLGKHHVFHDVRDLTAGEDFPDALARKITGCDVLLAIIGKTWLGVREDGTRRIDSENDWVRKEVAHALSAGKGVIPVLVDGASLPQEDELPGDLGDMRNKNARPIAGGENYEVSIDRLIKGIYVEAKRSRAARKNRPSAALKR